MSLGLLVLVDVVLAAELDSVFIVHPLEGTLGDLERGELSEKIGIGLGLDTVAGVDNHVLKGLEEILECDVSELSFKVSKLGEMASGSALLGTVRLSEAEHLTEDGNSGLKVQLRRLGEVGGLSKVVELEEGGTTLHLSLYKCGRNNLGVSLSEKVFTEALGDNRTHAENVDVLELTELNVTLVEEVVDVRLAVDDVLNVSRGLTHKLPVVGGNLNTALVSRGELLQSTPHAHERLTVQRRSILSLDEVSSENTLEGGGNTGSVAEVDKHNLSTVLHEMDKAGHLDALSEVLLLVGLVNRNDESRLSLLGGIELHKLGFSGSGLLLLTLGRGLSVRLLGVLLTLLGHLLESGLADDVSFSVDGLSFGVEGKRVALLIEVIVHFRVAHCV